MHDPVTETVLFRLNGGVSETDFLAAAQTVMTFVEAQPGFIRRRLSCTEDGTWIDTIEWASMTDAKRAAAAIGKADAATPFLTAIDGPSVRLMHSEIKGTWN